VLMPFAGTLADRVSRRTVMLAADIARVFCALIFLLVDSPKNLWIAYLAAITLSTFTAFFEAAKNATLPNLVGRDGLLAGNALMFTPRFLLMAVGAALGGVVSAFFGYKTAFVINSISFALSAFAVWQIPESMTRQASVRDAKDKRERFFKEAAQGLKFTTTHRLPLTIILCNMIWAIGGGASNIINERLGGISFAAKEGWRSDTALGALYFATGLGLFGGMLLSHKVGLYVERNKLTYQFIGGSIVVHGLLFSLGGLMPTLWLVGVMFFLSRLLIGAEYGLQETLLQRSIPDHLRGRVLTLDRGAEISVFSLVGFGGGYAMHIITPETLAIVSGIFMASAGVLWFWRERDARAEIGEQ
jgi:MFS family permease